MDPDRARPLRHLGGGGAGRRPPADAAYLRAQGLDRAAAHAGPEPSILATRHRVAAAHPGADPGRRRPGGCRAGARPRTPARATRSGASQSSRPRSRRASPRCETPSKRPTASTGAISSRHRRGRSCDWSPTIQLGDDDDAPRPQPIHTQDQRSARRRPGRRARAAGTPRSRASTCSARSSPRPKAW